MSSPTVNPHTDHTHTAAAGSTVAIGSWPQYADAQRLVDRLSDDGVDVSGVQIVATDLSVVEDVTGRRTTASAALQGAGSGAMFGFLLGALLGSFSLDPLVSLWIVGLYGLVIGAVMGAALGAIAHAALRGRRDFSATSRMQAGRYTVMAPAHVAAALDEAKWPAPRASNGLKSAG